MSIEATATLLREVFPAATRISEVAYLRWLYEQSPFGPAIEANRDDALGRAGHYAIVPIDLIENGQPQQAALSLNTAVHERARGEGLFVGLATATYEQARAAGIEAVIGVGNANSTPGLERRLGFEVVTPLPTTMLAPTPGRTTAVDSAWASAAAFEPGGVAADVERLLQPPATGIARAWTPETLRWRLASPGSRYALHRADDALVVTELDRRWGMPVAVVLKIFAAAPFDKPTSRALVRAACRFHRAPFALHVGLDDMVELRGLPLPRRLLPSPLNLVYRRLDGGPRTSPIMRLEFLDFDAY